jgi:hypothetical protein
VPRTPDLSLQMAVSALTNARTTTTVETKGGHNLVEYTYPAELLTAMKSMFPASKTYRFEVHSSATVAATAGGVIAGSFAWSPGVGSYAEYPALQALFDEVRILRSHLTWTSAFGPTSTAIVAQIALAPDVLNNGVSPSSFTPVMRLAESKFFNIAVPGDGGSYSFTKVHHLKDRVYSSTASPNPQSPVAGCTGQWSWASNIVTTPSINYAFLVVANTLQFRARA